MTRRARTVRGTATGICAMTAAALLALWCRSGTNVDALAWTTSRPDPAVAAAEFPARWNMLGGIEHDAAARTFAIRSEAGRIHFERSLYVSRAPSTVGLFGSEMQLPLRELRAAPSPF